MDWYVRALTKYFELDGRASRREYWGFVGGGLLVSGALWLGAAMAVGAGVAHAAVSLVAPAHALLVDVPGAAASVRRLHDTNHSGWWAALVLLPLIGPLFLLGYLVTRGDEGENEYGPPPSPTLPAAGAAEPPLLR